MKKILFILLFIIPLSIFAKNVVNVGTIVSPPFVSKSTSGEYSGITFELWNKIAHSLNIDSNVKEYRNIDEMLLALDRNEIDVTVYSLTINHERLSKYNFSQPYFITNSKIIYKNNTSSLYSLINNIFSSRFISLFMWLIIIILSLGVVIWIVEHKNNDLITSNFKGLFNCFYFIVCVVGSQGFGDIVTKTKNGKFIMIFIIILTMICSGILTGSIASQLTLDTMNTNEIENISKLRILKTASVKNSTSSKYLDLNDIKHIKYDNISECLSDLVDGELDCIFYDEEQLKYLLKNYKNENLVLSNKSFCAQTYGFCSNDFNFKKINLEILKLTNTKEWIKLISEN